MTRLETISMLFLAAAMAVPVAHAAGHTAITTERIASAISAAGIRVQARDVALMAEVVATTSAPALRVEHMERFGDHKMMVRMACASGEECLPFMVTVQLSDENAAQAPANLATAAVSRATAVMHAGSPAILLLDGHHVHVQLAVVCLESGAPGQKIRVTTKDRQQTYTAEVVDHAVLRGTL